MNSPVAIVNTQAASPGAR